ncbi:MAG: hypothetical protein OYH77_06130 [Pseudomonadota bacterium]|nr:hypothetical protein [Pseudomonadota bacterium]
MLDVELKLLNDCDKGINVLVWIPPRPIIVLGNGDKRADTCFQDKCVELGVHIARRKGGGSAVLLHEDCLIVSIGMWVEQFFHNKKYFDLLNSSLIKTLTRAQQVFAQLTLKGISDIAYDNRKVAGTTIFRSRNFLLYQASLLFHARAQQISALLKQPMLMPDYRNARTHADFLLGLAEIAPDVSINALRQRLNKQLVSTIQQAFGQQLIVPPPSQVATLKARAAQTKVSYALMT